MTTTNELIDRYRNVAIDAMNDKIEAIRARNMRGRKITERRRQAINRRLELARELRKVADPKDRLGFELNGCLDAIA